MQFLAAGCGCPILGNEHIDICDVKIDSRECVPGDMFVAVKGSNTDGHKYLQSAYELGCRAFLISERSLGEAMLEKHPDCGFVLCSDTSDSLKDMAMAYLGQFDVMRIGITGSTGKTSTRTFTQAVLAERFNTVSSRKNLNTHLGICLTAFLAEENTQAVVFEMGMDRHNELLGYCRWLKPQIAVITSIGLVHMEYIGSPEGIALEKLQISSSLQPGQPLIYNCDTPFLSREYIKAHTGGDFVMIPVGLGEEAEIRLSGIENRGLDGIAFVLSAGGESCRVELPVLGEHNAHNAALAAAVGMFCGMSLEECAGGLKKAVPEEKRLELVRLSNGVLFLDDTYNANPDSMKAGLGTLAGVDAKRKIAVISDMRELGDASEQSHREVGRYAADCGIDFLVLIGENREQFAMGARESSRALPLICFPDTDSATDFVLNFLQDGDALLIKGSHYTYIDRLAQIVKDRFK